MPQAFVLRMTLGGADRVPEALECNHIFIGWSDLDSLLDDKLSWEKTRALVKDMYHPDDQDLRRAGADTGDLWRFIREMEERDLVVVPHESNFYVAKIIGNTTYNPTKVSDDTAHRRKVTWLNNKQPIPRTSARSALISRMRYQRTCARASDLIDEIQECLDNAASNYKPTFHKDLQEALIKKTLEKLQSGFIDNNSFESLICEIMKDLGAPDARVVARNQDKGADVLATFRVAGVFGLRVAIQAKYFRPEPPVTQEAVEELIRGIKAEEANLGIVITSGTISSEAEEAAKRYYEESGIRIEFLDGYQFAKLIVENGVSAN